NHRQLALVNAPAVNVAVAAAHWAQSRTQISARGVQHRFAKGEAAGQIANEWGKDIALAQGQPERSAQGLLAGAEEGSAGDIPAGLVERGQLLVESPRQKHPAVSSDVACLLGFVLVGRGGGLNW